MFKPGLFGTDLELNNSTALGRGTRLAPDANGPFSLPFCCTIQAPINRLGSSEQDNRFRGPPAYTLLRHETLVRVHQVRLVSGWI
ncbi:unnamed protein product [Protopolystoma xenopodis]|uniref:Uncharacterized protein n=1 Tax=Protopolystoma xenopodis TaxID=117903 RepID=A0A3S5CUC9_9PLAT|nr:unnamed protein product [Protopolystoma xenopodis]